MICDKDCFNCHYPDCINDELSLEEYQENVIDVDVPESVKKARIQKNRYAEKHREENRERSRQHYNDNKEAYHQQACEWAKNNKSRVAAAKKERYYANLEFSRQKQRDYRARKKAERVS